MAFSPSFPISLIVLFSGCSLVKLFLFARKDTPIHCFVTAYAAFVLTFSSAVLLPFDIVMTVDLGRFDSSIKYIWRIMYWSLWMLNWFFLPVFIEQQRTGSWHVSLRNNSYYWIAYAIAGIIMLAYYLGTVGYTSFSEIYNFFYAMSFAFSNAYGLVLISVLLGYSFVALPQHLAQISDPGKYLLVLYARIVAADEDRLNSKFDLEDAFSAYRQNKANETPNAVEIFTSSAKFLNRSITEPAHLRTTRRVESSGQTFIENLSPYDTPLGKLSDALGKAERAVCKFEHLVGNCVQIEDDLAGSVSELRKRVRKAELIVFKIGAYLTGGLSFVTIVAQSTIFIPVWWLSILAVLYRFLIKEHVDHSESDMWSALLQVLVAIPLIYAYLASFWAAFRFKLSNSYGLYPNHNTDAFSLMWCSSIMSRTAFSICYNYIFVLRMQNDQEDTAFMSTMKKLSMVPLFGSTFVTVLPMLILVLAVMQYTRTYQRIIHWLGLTMLQMESAVYVGAGENLVKDGKAIVARERQKKMQTNGDGNALGRAEKLESLINGFNRDPSRSPRMSK